MHFPYDSFDFLHEPIYFKHYDYRAAVAADVKTYIRKRVNLADFPSRDALEEHLMEECEVETGITGLGNGGYPANPDLICYWVVDNLDLLREAICEHDLSLRAIADAFRDSRFFELDYEIRSYVLDLAIDDVLDGIYGKEDSAHA